MTKTIKGFIIYAIAVAIGIVGTIPLIHIGSSPLTLALCILCCSAGGIIIIEFDILEKIRQILKEILEVRNGERNQNRHVPNGESGLCDHRKPIRSDRRARSENIPNEVRGNAAPPRNNQKNGRS